ncbi:hypothetical protein RvY_08483 [Ramazzottius varieornatus]|uniref:Uncharacterized protein n=1 Tax=Ramazzottius varieornatus TaxID=947166 RepID=A0A1D1V893_RAMVA|nr:hypothetical protein RvY_08483 [Ramazzottius varieornatus]
MEILIVFGLLMANEVIPAFKLAGRSEPSIRMELERPMVDTGYQKRGFHAKEGSMQHRKKGSMQHRPRCYFLVRQAK